MDFVFREATEADLDQCLELTEDRFLYDPKQLAALRKMWLDMMASKLNIGAVLADARELSRVVYFAFWAFVSDERADAYHRVVKPKIAQTMAEELMAGGRPYLDRDAVARANARGGVNYVVTHYGVLHTFYDDPAELEKVRAASYDVGRRGIRGWNLRTFTNEVYARNPERDGKEMGEALGFKATRYTDAQLDDAGIPREKQPWLWLATRQAAIEQGMSTATLFLQFTEPRFGFSMPEQDILKLALDGHTDESIADLTAASLATVKKRFRTIYDKVKDASVDSEALGGAEAAQGTRGSESRRYLLSYLRENPNELRPYAP